MDGNEESAKIDLEDLLPAAFPDEETHDRVLLYLLQRLKSSSTQRLARMRRFARIDRTVSTWQKLSNEDTQRVIKQETTGVAQAVSVNLPLVHTHLEDMVSFYAQIYSPAVAMFFQQPESNLNNEAGKKLKDKMNADAEASKYFKWLASFIRTILKYNVGGLEIQWGDEDGLTIDQVADGMNHVRSLDMYNLMWDITVKDPAKIRNAAEWAAVAEIVNPMFLIRREKVGTYAGVKRALPEMEIPGKNHTNHVVFYKHPPGEANITAEDQTTGSAESNVDWASYGASLDNEGGIEVEGHELVRMYCWLNPQQFGLMSAEQVTNDYALWQFHIVDAEHIVYAQPVMWTSRQITFRHEIPFYAGFLLQDEMGANQRSTGELMSPFQNFASFLMNAHVLGARSSIYGIQGYDPHMFDFSKVEAGSTAVRIPSLQPGRDVRSGLMKLDGSAETQNTMQNLMFLMQFVKEFFPAQALPSQIAGIDRAIGSQVAAVLQGAGRRQHMLVRTMDADIMNPFTHALFRNIAYNSNTPLTGLTDEQARRILGSGLQQLTIEQAEQAFRELLFAVIQNAQAAQELDVVAMVTYWASLMNIPAPVETFRRQQAPAPGADGQPPAGNQPPPGQPGV
jgi:hypothetical protein